MVKSLFLDTYVRQLVFPVTVVYVEQEWEEEINGFVRGHLEELVWRFGTWGVNFVYVPALLESGAYERVVAYNHPYLVGGLKGVETKAVYGALCRAFGVVNKGAGMLMVESYRKGQVGAFLPLKGVGVSMGDFEAMESAFFPVMGEAKALLMDEPRVRPVKRSLVTFSEFVSEPAVEYGSDVEAEVEAMVSRLKELGSVRLIGKVIDELQKVTSKVSRLFITGDFRIFLKDYGMKEVVMQPLAKCLFLLYLRHEEGIRFKQLSEYQDELLSIYKEMTLRERPNDVEESIMAMTNPLDNSVNEKCSRIRAAFLAVVAEELAAEYYITGKKGEVKGIRLDRGLVEYQ